MVSRKSILLFLFICYVASVGVRLSAPSDLDNRDQAKQGLYVIDVVKNGRFFLPTLRDVEPATKPPLYTWAAAGVSLVRGDVTELTIRLPSVLCGLGVVLIAFIIGEMLVSRQVGLLAGLILISNYHFVSLACTARTDMMLCLFISLGLLFFLKAYNESMEAERNLHVLLAFVCLGLGTITKGPVAPALVFLIVLVFLWLEKDLAWLSRVPLVRGVAILLLITLAWFIPAVIQGGRKFIDIVVFDETVNRFLGIGGRAHKGKPFYYLVGHFFPKFMPWSFFVPIAFLWRRNLKESGKRSNSLFLYVWFLVVLVFFSISKGKRPDYLLPLYPAASLVVAQLWASHFESTPENRHWGKYVLTISTGYMGGCVVMAIALLAFALAADPAALVERIPFIKPDEAALLPDALGSQTGVIMAIAIPLCLVSVAGIVFALAGRFKKTFIATLLAGGFVMLLYFLVLSPKALRGSGEEKKEFCEEAKAMAGANDSLQFLNVKNSILFYMGRNPRPLTQDEALNFLENADSPLLITTGVDFLELSRRADFEISLLLQSEYIVREEQIYVLIGRAPAHKG